MSIYYSTTEEEADRTIEAEFTDEMGWHVVEFEQIEAAYIQIEVLDWYEGKDTDFCISELELLDDLIPVDLGLTPVVMANGGAECCESLWDVMRLDGKVLRPAGQSTWEGFSCNSTRRYILSETPTLNYVQFWVMDIETGEFITHLDIPKSENWEYDLFEVTWKSNSVSLTLQKAGQDNTTLEKSITLSWENEVTSLPRDTAPPR